MHRYVTEIFQVYRYFFLCRDLFLDNETVTGVSQLTARLASIEDDNELMEGKLLVAERRVTFLEGKKTTIVNMNIYYYFGHKKLFLYSFLS